MGGGEHESTRWCVVVADDDSDWRMLMSIALQRAGYDVVGVCDGDELVTFYRNLERMETQRLIVVSDIEMPRRSGIDAAADLRSMQGEVPVVFVTGTPSPDIVDAAWKAGGRAVLRKPVNAAHIVETVNRIREQSTEAGSR